MSSLNQLLERVGLQYEDLNSAEKDTLKQWLEVLSKRQLTIEELKLYLRQLIEAVEKQLTDLSETTSFFSFLSNRKKDIYLKARLRNYLIISDFLNSPERAQKYIEQQLTNIKK